MDWRIAEQTLSGNIPVKDGRISLTPQSRGIVGGARLVGGWFGADPHFVNAAPTAPAH
ncbi:MAG: hypothetical protein AB7E60_07440 [Sphingobium sp.]